MGNHITLHASRAHVTRSSGNVKFAADIAGRDRSARGGELGIAFDFFKADGTRGGAHGYGTSDISNDLGAGSHSGVNFGIVRNLNAVSDRDVAQIGEFFTDADGRTFLLDGRTCDGIVEALLWIVKAKSRGAHLAVDVHLAVGAARNVHVARGVGQFETKRTGDTVIAVEGAADGRSGVAAGQDKDGREQHER